MKTFDKPTTPHADVPMRDCHGDSLVTRIEQAFRKVKDNDELKELRTILEEYYAGHDS